MSGWKAYVNEMMKNGSCSQAAVCGAYDGTIWAKTPGFNLYEYEICQDKLEGETEILTVCEPELLLEPFKNNGTMVSDCGMHLNKEKWFIVNYNPDMNSIYLKRPKGGACLVKTTQVVLVGFFDEGTVKNKALNAGNCNKDLEILAEKLRNVGY